MTLLKQTTGVSRADDSLACSEYEEDLQTDCCSTLSLTVTSASLETGLQTLTLGDDTKTSKSEHSCESGIASLSASYCTQESSLTFQKHEGTRLIEGTEHDGSKDEVSSQTDCEKVCVPTAEDRTESHRKKKEKVVRQECWDEMCERFPDKDGDTLLHLAVLQTVTHLSHLVRLLGLHGQVNCRNRLYQTPLHLAVLTGNGPALALLPTLGASLLLQDCRGNTPLHTACLRNDAHVLRVLLEGNARGHEDTDADIDTDTETVVGEDDNIQLQHPGSRVGEFASGRLREGSRVRGAKSEPRGDEEEDRDEISNGCDVDSAREGPEMEPVGGRGGDSGEKKKKKNMGVGVRERVEREVRVALCVKNYEGFTCLHLAVLHGNARLVALLLRHGADVNVRDGKSGRTALHLAVDTPHPNSAVLSTLLLHPQLHINATNFAQQTALQLARGRHHLDLVELLHMRGARWLDSIHGYSSSSSDSFSEEDGEEDLFVPYDDLRVAGQLLTAAQCS